MNRIARLLCLLWLLLLWPAGSVMAQDVETELFECAASWNQSNLGFEQKVYDEDGALIDHYHGILQTLAPNRLRWEITKPHKELIIYDGENVWHYQPDLKQAVYSQLGDDHLLYALLQGDATTMRRHYTVRAHETENKRYILSAKTEAAHNTYGQLEVVLRDGCNLHRMLWRDESDQLVVLYLRPRRGSPKSTQFVFHPSADIFVYEQ